MLLFGSRVTGRWVVDTVFVVRASVDHDADSSRARLATRVPAAYHDVVLGPTYATDTESSYRLYIGATYDEPFEGMFSFFPCAPTDRLNAFARPQVILPDVINPNSFQALKGAGRGHTPLSILTVKRLWDSCRQQVLDQGLALGVRATVPEQRA